MRLFEQVLPNTYLLKSPFGEVWSGIFLVTGKENILIDTGATAQVIDDVLLPGLKEIGLELIDIEWIINTHSHGDHVGGNRRIVELSPNTKVAAFEGAVDKIQNPLPYGVAIRTRFPEHSLPPQTVLDGCKVDLSIKDGDVLANRLRIIHTPGHDSDTICLFDLETNALFTGDSLQCAGMVSKGVAGLAFYQDLAGYRETIDKVRNLNPKHILAAHEYAPFGYRASGENEVQRYLQSCADTVNLYDALVRSELDKHDIELADLTKSIILQTGAEMPQKMFLAMYSIEQHRNEFYAQKRRGAQ